MKVKLKQDIEQDGQIRQSRRRAATVRRQLQKQEDGTFAAVEVPVSVGSEPFLWVKGAVVEMSEASAQKYIEQGLADECDS